MKVHWALMVKDFIVIHSPLRVVAEVPAAIRGRIIKEVQVAGMAVPVDVVNWKYRVSTRGVCLSKRASLLSTLPPYTRPIRP